MRNILTALTITCLSLAAPIASAGECPDTATGQYIGHGENPLELPKLNVDMEVKPGDFGDCEIQMNVAFIDVDMVVLDKPLELASYPPVKPADSDGLLGFAAKLLAMVANNHPDLAEFAAKVALNLAADDLSYVPGVSHFSSGAIDIGTLWIWGSGGDLFALEGRSDGRWFFGRFEFLEDGGEVTEVELHPIAGQVFPAIVWKP